MSKHDEWKKTADELVDRYVAARNVGDESAEELVLNYLVDVDDLAVLGEVLKRLILAENRLREALNALEGLVQWHCIRPDPAHPDVVTAAFIAIMVTHEEPLKVLQEAGRAELVDEERRRWRLRSVGDRHE